MSTPTAHMPPRINLSRRTTLRRWIMRPASLLDELHRQCGDIGTMQLRKGVEITATRDPEGVKAIFTANPELVPTGASRSPIAPLLGPSSVIVLNGPEHLRQRRLLLPPFHGERLRGYVPVIEAIAQSELDSWRPGQEFRLHGRMQAITLEVILRVVFGVDDDERFQQLRTAIVRMLSLTERPAVMVPTFLLTARLGRLRGPIARAARAVDRLLYEEIAAHRQRDDLEDRNDILSLLVQARDEHGEPMTDDELRDELMTLLLAGHETTATALSWAVERLVRTPDVMERATRAAAEDDDEYLDALVNETLRLRPVVPIVVRSLTGPLEIQGYTLPRGTVVAINIVATNRNPHSYPEPNRFDPERYVGRKPDTYAWTTFGGGSRRCIGAAFAQLEMRLILKAMLQRAELVAVNPASERIRRRNITLVPEHGTTVRVAEMAPRPARTPAGVAA